MSRLVEGARTLVGHLAERLQADLSIQLWTGEVLPLGPTARDDIRLTVRSPEVIARLLRSPRLMTLVELFVAGKLDIEGGSPLEAAQRWDHMKALALTRTIDRKLIIKSLWPFLFLRESRDRQLTFREQIQQRYDDGRDDSALIQFHYDVSNEFYELFLDPEMQYSPGYFQEPATGLAEAQIAKLDRICRKLRLSSNDYLLDIGCGWGGLVCHAAQHFDAQALGVTLSQEQFDAAQERVRNRGLSGRVRIELRDFRSIEDQGAFTKIAQIGMFEHVGIDNHDDYFTHVSRLLKPGGLYLHDAITRRAPLNLKQFRKRSPYAEVLNRYIFPGGELDYLGMTITNLERHGFEVRDVESMREHYYLSLKNWSESLYARRDVAIRLVGAERVRLWLLYFAMCCVGFSRGAMYDFQTVAMKRQTGLSGLPFVREETFECRVS